MQFRLLVKYLGDFTREFIVENDSIEDVAGRVLIFDSDGVAWGIAKTPASVVRLTDTNGLAMAYTRDGAETPAEAPAVDPRPVFEATCAATNIVGHRNALKSYLEKQGFRLDPGQWAAMIEEDDDIQFGSAEFGKAADLTQAIARAGRAFGRQLDRTGYELCPMGEMQWAVPMPRGRTLHVVFVEPSEASDDGTV